MSYNSIVYNSVRTPKTNYPFILCNYLVNRFSLSKNSKLLDVGSGRGEFSDAFLKLGIDSYAIDIEENLERNQQIPFFKCDLENEEIPFNDGYFDIIFHKSFLEHFYKPEDILGKLRKKLRPGGILIGLVPDWHTQYKTFYHDHTHRTPFMRESLEDLMKILQFKEVKVEIFRQLPLVWKYKYFQFLSILTQYLLPDLKILNKIKWIRFSKELMILSYGQK